MSKKGPNHLIQAALSRECGHFSKMYNALYECCGGGLNARSIATVWTTIIDRTASEEIAGKLVNDGGKNWIVFNDGYWLLRLRMSRPTMKGALDWLEGAGVLAVKKEKKGQSYPTRYVALVPGTLETIIGEIKGKGGPVEDLEYPLLMSDGVLLPPSDAAPKRADLRREKAPKNGIQLRPEDRGKGLTKGRQMSYKRSSKDTPTKCKESDDKTQEVLPATVRGLTTKRCLEEITEGIEKGIREDFSANPDSLHLQEEALATHATCGVDLLRKVQDISLVSGNEQQQAKPSETKETQKPPTPNLSGEDVEAPEPLSPEDGWKLAKETMAALSALEGQLWYSIGYSKETLAKTVQKRWKYAVRGSALRVIQKLAAGTPGIPTWRFTDDDGEVDQDKANALVQAWLQYAGLNGLDDPWAPLAGMDQDTRWKPGIVLKNTQDAPTFDDPDFKRIYRRLLRSITK